MRTRPRPTTKADETPEFVEFWTAWRPHMNKNDGRGAARDVFFHHVEEFGADPQDIVDGAKWALHNGVNQGDFRVHASTWLNRRPYEDGADMWREFQRRQQELAEERENVVPIQKAPLPENHFSRRWERGEFKKQG